MIFTYDVNFNSNSFIACALCDFQNLLRFHIMTDNRHVISLTTNEYLNGNILPNNTASEHKLELHITWPFRLFRLILSPCNMRPNLNKTLHGLTFHNTKLLILIILLVKHFLLKIITVY